jgi:hypothetical protein
MIFIVDDDEAARDSLRLLLECEGLEAREFASCGYQKSYPGWRRCRDGGFVRITGGLGARPPVGWRDG